MQTQTKGETADLCPECGQPMERVYLSAAGPTGFLLCPGDPPVGFIEQTKAVFTAKQVCDESGMPVLGIVNDFPARHCRPCRRVTLRYG
jgi:hypothetical protein